mmetsp:Transcript_58839/g.167457  ORF Transcript_58839/g.167457 Transcript_58839/m.167457 type:complete len:222 (+) Transcript_58839:348-1013(+)
MTPRYFRTTLASSTYGLSKKERVCFIQFSSSRSGYVSWACAPRDSWRASAECISCAAWLMRFSSSRVSMRSVFQIMLRSEMPTSLYSFMMLSMMPFPTFKSSAFRYTGAYFCMLTCSLVRSTAVGIGPLQLRILSMRAIVASPALPGSLTGALFGLTSSAVVSAAWRPKTTRSSSEFAPRRFAPCTEAEPASPAARRPGTMVLHSPRSTWVFQFVGTPPML